MTTFFVSRHSGALEWLQRHHPDLANRAQVIAHADRHFFARLQPGDVVVGVLPIYLIAKVCERRARYFALSVPKIPPERRGHVLSADELEAYGAHLNEYLALEGEALNRLREKCGEIAQ